MTKRLGMCGADKRNSDVDFAKFSRLQPHMQAERSKAACHLLMGRLLPMQADISYRCKLRRRFR